MEVDDSLPNNYMGKHCDEELLLLNDTMSVPSSLEPSTLVHEAQQVQSELSLPSEPKDEMKAMFEMSMVGELTYFLGLQVKQTDFGIYINQGKYAKNLVKRFGLDKAAHARTLMAANAKLTNNPLSESVDVTLYRGMIGCLFNADDRKSTTGGCLYVGANLVAWMSKKQNFVSLSIAKAEHIAVGSCCSQFLWLKNLLSDYGISQDTMLVYCDNSSSIDISKNPIQHSKTKQIEIRYYFIRDLVERKIVALEYIPTEPQNADIFTKPLDTSKFETLRQVIGVILCP
ncbi:uncharacterized protein LOC111984684 [Quercus suber]|uniref:uncharacterized protein LOC111984684 n=1 Tax=Quercus suber TaxID=58331 RepID=UPI000CE1C673|nr:uncharacterized protein LOC111984684 [Quercus suber]